MPLIPFLKYTIFPVIKEDKILRGINTQRRSLYPNGMYFNLSKSKPFLQM